MILVGVDAGGTSTRGVAVSESGRPIGSARGGPGALHERTAVEAAQAIARVVLEATGGEAAEVVVAGVSGAADPEVGAALHQALEGQGVGKRVHVVADAAIALEGAFPGQAGIVVIAGTGSVAWGRNASGEEARAGGWGYLLDRGSGVDIGRRVLAAVLRAHESGAPATRLTAEVGQVLGLGGVDDLARAVRALRTADLAGLAPSALVAAATGEAVAQEILTDAAEDLARAAQTVWNRLRFAAPHPVAGTGRLFSHPMMREAFRMAMRRACPQADVRSPHMPPVGGALWKAFALGGREFPAVIRSALEETPLD
ncbi:MAG: BadF/BadG/BcrA/BcrD ATPase family protein [bacterium]